MTNQELRDRISDKGLYDALAKYIYRDLEDDKTAALWLRTQRSIDALELHLYAQTSEEIPAESSF